MSTGARLDACPKEKYGKQIIRVPHAFWVTKCPSLKLKVITPLVA